MGKVSALEGSSLWRVLSSSNLRLHVVVMPPDLEDAGRPEWKSQLKRDDHRTFKNRVQADRPGIEDPRLVTGHQLGRDGAHDGDHV